MMGVDFHLSWRLGYEVASQPQILFAQGKAIETDTQFLT